MYPCHFMHWAASIGFTDRTIANYCKKVRRCFSKSGPWAYHNIISQETILLNHDTFLNVCNDKVGLELAYVIWTLTDFEESHLGISVLFLTKQYCFAAGLLGNLYWYISLIIKMSRIVMHYMDKSLKAPDHPTYIFLLPRTLATKIKKTV